MLINFACHAAGCSPNRWNAAPRILKTGNPCEAEVSARGSSFHLIAGNHAYGNYLCIPDWNVGTELGTLTDRFWNEERLLSYTGLGEVDTRTVVTALNLLADYMT